MFSFIKASEVLSSYIRLKHCSWTSYGPTTAGGELFGEVATSDSTGGGLCKRCANVSSIVLLSLLLLAVPKKANQVESVNHNCIMYSPPRRPAERMMPAKMMTSLVTKVPSGASTMPATPGKEVTSLLSSIPPSPTMKKQP